jgi:hypothetical protein
MHLIISQQCCQYIPASYIIRLSIKPEASQLVQNFSVPISKHVSKLGQDAHKQQMHDSLALWPNMLEQSDDVVLAIVGERQHQLARDQAVLVGQMLHLTI